MPQRRIYGRVYELILRGQQDHQHSYVGKCTTTIHQRVHGPNGHTSRASAAKDPWKADILRGSAGYRLLETVYDTDTPAENERALRRAEAFWIDRLRPEYNIVRPVRPPGDRPAPRPRREPRMVRRPRRRRINLRVPALLALMLLYGWMTARVAVNMPWPQAPWIASPIGGVALGWLTYWKIHRSVRRLLR